MLLGVSGKMFFFFFGGGGHTHVTMLCLIARLAPLKMFSGVHAEQLGG